MKRNVLTRNILKFPKQNFSNLLALFCQRVHGSAQTDSFHDGFICLKFFVFILESWVILCEPLAQRLITHAFLSCPGDDKITVKKMETFTKDDYKYNSLYCKKTSSCTKLRSNGTQMISSICNGNSFCSIKQNIYSDIILHDSSCLFSKVHKKSYNWLKVYYTCTQCFINTSEYMPFNL